MKTILFALLLSASPLLAQTAHFASQSDLVIDLSDSVLDDIYHHRIGYADCSCERSIWLGGFGSYRERCSTSDRERYDNWLGGIIGGLNYSLCPGIYVNLIAGGSWGGIDIRDSLPSFDVGSFFLGMTWERLWQNSFIGLAIAGGYLGQERTVRGLFGEIVEKPRGVFFTPELTGAFRLTRFGFCPLLTGTIRYAGFFSRDYQHREVLGTLYIRDRDLQFFTLRGELAIPLSRGCFALQPYIGGAGRFQFDGDHVTGRLLLNDQRFSDGIDDSIGYGFLGVRGSMSAGRFDLQGNVEGSYDTDDSWRVLGELSLNFAY